MDIENIRKDNTLVLVLKGDVDFNSCRKLKETLERAVDDRLTPIVLNLAAVDHIDSMGLGTVTKMWKKSHELGLDLSLAGCNKNVEKMVHLINLDKRIKLYATSEEALGEAPASGD